MQQGAPKAHGRLCYLRAFASRAAKDAARASGASAFLAKPVAASALLLLVHDKLERAT